MNVALCLHLRVFTQRQNKEVERVE
jgi:hypothetical protein